MIATTSDSSGQWINRNLYPWARASTLVLSLVNASSEPHDSVFVDLFVIRCRSSGVANPIPGRTSYRHDSDPVPGATRDILTWRSAAGAKTRARQNRPAGRMHSARQFSVRRKKIAIPPVKTCKRHGKYLPHTHAGAVHRQASVGNY
jgi:hypothetical protein